MWVLQSSRVGESGRTPPTSDLRNSMPPELKKRGGMRRRKKVKPNQKEPSMDDNPVPKRSHDAASAKLLLLKQVA